MFEFANFSREYENEAKIIAKAFMKLGLKRHYSVAIIGFNSAEWFFSFMGAIYAGYLLIII